LFGSARPRPLRHIAFECDLLATYRRL